MATSRTVGVGRVIGLAAILTMEAATPALAGC